MTEQDAENWPTWKLHLQCLIGLIPALIVGIAEDFDISAQELDIRAGRVLRKGKSDA